jgi:hypothetical protein
MNRRVSLLVVLLCGVLEVLAQPAKREAPSASEFALEYLSRSDGFPSYWMIPPPAGSLGIGSGPPSAGNDAPRKGVRISVDQNLPGTLRIHFSVADDLPPYGLTSPDDGAWRDTGDYTLRISENQKLTVPENERVHVLGPVRMVQNGGSSG